MKRYIPQLSVIGLALVLVPFLANAWTAAPASPPSGNVSAPINVGGTQAKAGGLNLGDSLTVTSATGGVSVNGTMYAGQGIGIGTSPYDTNGSVNALKYCINGANCIAAWPSGGGGGVSSISQGTGMTFSSNPITTTGTISLNTSGISACTNASTNKIYWNGSTLVCGTDQTGGGGGTMTSLSAGSGITLSPSTITTSGTISANTSVIQSRVNGTCAAGSSIRVIDASGNVTCQTDGGGSVPTFDQVVAAGNSANRTVVISGSNRLYFNSSGVNDPSFYESFGLHYSGNGAHPFMIDGGQLRANAGLQVSGGNLDVLVNNIAQFYSPPRIMPMGGTGAIQSYDSNFNFEIGKGSSYPVTTFNLYNYTTGPVYGAGLNLHVYGNVTAVAFTPSSDRSLKTDIMPLNGSLDKIAKLQGVSFKLKDGGKPSIGLIAQDVEKIYPELISKDPKTGLEALDYMKLVAPLIESVKEQQRQIETLNARIKALEATHH